VQSVAEKHLSKYAAKHATLYSLHAN